MKSVIKCSYKADVGAGAGAGAETFWKLEPERKKKVSAPQHWWIGHQCDAGWFWIIFEKGQKFEATKFQNCLTTFNWVIFI